MTPTVRVLRVALPIVFVGFVAILIASYTSNVRDENRPPAEVPKNLRPNDNPNIVAKAFEDVQTIAGRVALKISADRTIGFESGWYTLEGVTFTAFQRDGRSFTVKAPNAQVNAKTREAQIKGGVRITSNDGIEVATESIHFDGSRILNEKVPVTFKIDDWQGSGGGLDFNIKDETLKLVQPVRASFQARKPGDPRIDLEATEATFERRTGNVSFKDKVKITRARDTIDADVVIGRFDQKQKRLTSLEGLGNVIMRLAENSALAGNGAAGATGTTTVTSDRFYTELGGAGELIAVHIVGEPAPARAVSEGTPRRTITAPHFRILVPSGVLNEIRADNHATLTEESVPPRIVTSFSMVLYFDAATRRASNAALDGGVTYREGKQLATSDRATYDLRSRNLILTAVPQVAPRLQTESEVLRANRIEVSGVEQILKATGSVFVELKQKQAGGMTPANDSALFPEKTPVFVNSDTATFRRNDKSAWFNGNVRAWQGTNTLFAKDVQITGGGETLFATGGVRAVLNNVKPASTAAKASTVIASSNEMTAKKSDRRVDLVGNVVVNEAGRVLKSEKAILFLDAKQKLDRVEATGDVKIDEAATKRKGSGQKAIYRLAQRNVTVYGTPAEISDPRGTVKGTEILVDLEKNKVNVISGATPTEATYNPQ